MTRLFNFLLIGLYLLWSAGWYATNAQAAEVTKNATVSAANDPSSVVNTVIAKLMKSENLPGVAVELYVDGKPYAYYFGYADIDKKTPVTKHTIFELGSISKLMTSLLFAQEIDASNMQLDSPLKQYVQDLPDTVNQVTLQELATHTAGLPANMPAPLSSADQLKDFLKTKWSNRSAIGNEWAYSNVGMDVLGYAVENSAHRSFGDLYVRHVVNPLKMEPLGVQVPNRYKKYCAQGYDSDGKPIAASSDDLFPAAVGIKASADDMQRFLSAAIGLPGTPERILYPMRMTQVAYVRLSDRMMQGLGWEIYPLDTNRSNQLINSKPLGLGPISVSEVFDKPIYSGNSLIDKAGSANGFRSYIALIPDKQSGIVILTNKSLVSEAVVSAAREILFNVASLHQANKTEETQPS